MLFTAAPLNILLIITHVKPALMRGAALKFLSCVLAYLSRAERRPTVRVSEGPRSELERDPVCRRLLPLQHCSSSLITRVFSTTLQRTFSGRRTGLRVAEKIQIEAHK